MRRLGHALAIVFLTLLTQLGGMAWLLSLRAKGFPLLPHLSHDDGRKLDIALWNVDESGSYQAGRHPSPIGYWAFDPRVDNAPDPCRETRGLSLRWDMAWLQPYVRKGLALDPERLGAALRWLTREGPEAGLGKVFVEPHIAQRSAISSTVIRFQGCRATRHDDHIHIELAN
ncbi:hypothetical protein [Algicella marina]|uniref:Uncharacterized protein n=1 Tax=Algicella marina TaxID=2683284 RepID=A0A6P1T578_9RHOB|nr:hypothetical protein [Algicella marina]QHQ36833.1 hypothetical protein GO499_17420 [Algicella marina]